MKSDGAGCTDGTYAFCVRRCPTGFSEETNSCTMAEPYKTLVFDFHKPAKEWANSSGISGTYKATATN